MAADHSRQTEFSRSIGDHESRKSSSQHSNKSFCGCISVASTRTFTWVHPFTMFTKKSGF